MQSQNLEDGAIEDRHVSGWKPYVLMASAGHPKEATVAATTAAPPSTYLRVNASEDSEPQNQTSINWAIHYHGQEQALRKMRDNYQYHW